MVNYSYVSMWATVQTRKMPSMIHLLFFPLLQTFFKTLAAMREEGRKEEEEDDKGKKCKKGLRISFFDSWKGDISGGIIWRVEGGLLLST